jgi:hypothetical protein
VCDCLDTLISPDGLLLVVSHLFAVPVSTYARVEKISDLNLGVRNTFVMSHTKYAELFFLLVVELHTYINPCFNLLHYE